MGMFLDPAEIHVLSLVELDLMEDLRDYGYVP